MAEQLGLFAPPRAASPAVCPRVPGPLCRDGREGRCPGKARCEELGELEAARLTQVCTGATKSAVEARTPPLPPGGRGGGHGDGSTAGSAPESAPVPNGANAEASNATTLVGGVADGGTGGGQPALPGADGGGGEVEGAAVVRAGALGGPGDGGAAPGLAGGQLLTCPLRPRLALIPPTPRCHDCPGAEACEEKQTAAIAGADAELARRRSAGEPVERWGTTAEDFAGVVDQDVELTPEELAEPTVRLSTRRSSLLHPTPAEANAAALSEACGACGSTTGAVFYERGPLAGLRRCWPCAKPALTTEER